MKTHISLLMGTLLVMSLPAVSADSTDVELQFPTLTAPSSGAVDCTIICCFEDNAVDQVQCDGDFVVYTIAPSGSAGAILIIVWEAANGVIDILQSDAQDIIRELIGDNVDLAASSAASACALCCLDNVLDDAQCYGDYLVRGAAPGGSAGAIVIIVWTAANGIIDVVQDDAQDIIDRLIGNVDLATSSSAAVCLLCCLDNALDNAQCYGDFIVQDANPGGSAGAILMIVWTAANGIIDVVQDDAQDLIEKLIGSAAASSSAEADIVCSDDPAGWTLCYVYGIVLMPSYQCTGMKIGVDWAQCLANADVDYTQYYYDQMCSYVFQPRVCDAVPVAVDVEL